VSVAHDSCVDRVTFDFTAKTADPPTYRIEYQPGPFKNAESGAPVPIAGQAFIVVRLSPAYSYDFENGVPTYTGPKQIGGSGAHHVREVHETGDSEGVMTWVVGVDAKRPFSVEATGIPQRRLVVTVY
jgi:hypothetical protein